MNRAILSLIILLFFSAAEQAQSASASANVAVQILTPLSVTSSGNLDFGATASFSSSHNITKVPDQGCRFQIQGDPNRGVTITFSQVTLNNQAWVNQHGGTLENLTFVPDVKQTGINSSYVNPTLVTSGNIYTIGDNQGMGELFIWVGGSLLIQANQALGDYTGVFSLSIAY